MSDRMDEVESIADSLQERGLPAFWRMKEDEKNVPRVETEKATIRDVADALETHASQIAEAFSLLTNEIDEMRKNIRRLENHRHALDKTFSAKPEM